MDFVAGSKAQDGNNSVGAENPTADGSMLDQMDHHNQAIQNHNLLIALGGVATRSATAGSHFSMPVIVYQPLDRSPL